MSQGRGNPKYSCVVAWVGASKSDHLLSTYFQDVDDRWSMLFPQLYVPGQQNLYFNKIVFVKCMVQGIYSSLILFFIPYGAMYNTMRSDGKAIADYQSFALMAQTCLLIVVSVQVSHPRRCF